MRGLLLLLFLLSVLTNPAISKFQSAEEGHISAVISEKGLVFAKDLLIQQAIKTLTPLSLPDVQKSIKIPLIGGVSIRASNITLYAINVSSSTIQPGESGIVIVASGGTARLSMNWSYSFRSGWLFPIEVSDQGSAFVEIEGMEVGLTAQIEDQEGTLKLTPTQCGCYMEDLSITVAGGASWFYQGFVNAFGDYIRSAVETTITDKITEGTLKLDSLLQTLPKEIDVGSVAAINVTFVDDPMLGNSSVEFDIDGLFASSKTGTIASFLHKNLDTLVSCGGAAKMLGISFDEAVFNSASIVHFQAGLMHWTVDKMPEQLFLNTAFYRFIIPQLYKKYPNEDMELNISVTSPPVIKITAKEFDATISFDMIANVRESGETVPVACMSVMASISGVVQISENNLVGRADLDGFTLTLKWSNVGSFHMSLIQSVMRAFLNTVFVPYINLQLAKGHRLPIVHGYTLQNAEIVTASSRIIVCSDIGLSASAQLIQYPLELS